MCFPTENTAARMPVHIIFLFFIIFIFVLLLSMQHNTFHHMTFDQMGTIIIICSLLQSKKKKENYFSQKRLIAINAFVIGWGKLQIKIPDQARVKTGLGLNT